MLNSQEEENKRRSQAMQREIQAFKNQKMLTPIKPAKLPKYTVAFDASVSPEARERFKGPVSAPAPVADHMKPRMRPMSAPSSRVAPPLPLPSVPNYSGMSPEQRRFAKQNYQEQMQALGHGLTARDQNITASTQRRGQDITGATAMQGHRVSAQGHQLGYDASMEGHANTATRDTREYQLDKERVGIQKADSEARRAYYAKQGEQIDSGLADSDMARTRAMNKAYARESYVRALSSGDPKAIEDARRNLESYDYEPPKPQTNNLKTGVLRTRDDDQIPYTVAPDGTITYGEVPGAENAPRQALGKSGRPGPTRMPAKQLTGKQWLDEQLEDEEY